MRYLVLIGVLLVFSACTATQDAVPTDDVGISGDIVPLKDVGCDCPSVYDPVCGVDGVTYGNSCNAECLGKEIASLGQC